MKELIKKTKIVWLLIFAATFLACEDDDDASLPQIETSFVHTINEDTGVVSFQNLSENADSYVWDFGDGTTSTLANPVKVYPTGNYTVVLTAENAAGATGTFEDQIVINIPLPINFPVNFDDPNVNYNVSTFNGASFAIVANPDPSGSNTSTSNVGAITNSGAAFEGIFFDFGMPIDLSGLKTVKVNFWSSTPIDVLLKLENGTGGPVETTASHGGTGWEEIYFTFDSSDAFSRFTLFVDGPGSTAGTFYFDDVSQIDTADVPCQDTELQLPIDFDCEGIDYAAKIVGNVSFTVVDNPQQSGINDQETKVGQITNVGAQWENAFFNLDVPIDFTNDKGITMKFYSDQALPLLLKFEDGTEAPVENVANHGGTGWEELTFVFESTASYSDMVLFVDGPGTAAGTFYVDDIEHVFIEPSEPFDSGLLVNGDFENGADPWTIGVGSDPAPVVTDGGNSYYSVDVQAAGNPFDVNVSQKLEIIEGTTYKLTFDAWSDRARSIVAGIGLSGGSFANTTETVNITTDRQTYEITLTATGFGAPDARVLFDSGAEVGLVNIDNVALVQESAPEPPFDDGLLTNGDFENGADPWTIGVGTDPVTVVTEAGNSYYSVDVQAAGNPFDVNMSQKLEIVEGSTYMLTFDAWSDRARSIVAGIGLSGGSFANTTEIVNITTDRQTYMVTLTATGFGAPDARVLFDSGAEVGIVNIDNVSLVLDSGTGGGGGCTTGAVAATTLPLDFEGCESFVSAFSSIGDDGVIPSLDANPSKSGINTSDNVLKVVRASGINRWGGVQNSFPAGVIDITTKVFKVKVYSSVADVTYRFELALDPQTDPVTGNPPPTFVQVSGGANEWVEIEFTFTGLPASPTTYNQLVIKPDNPNGSDGEVTSEERTFYFDDLRLE